ncbi:MAG: hypothetical protein D6722_09065, partial [Bacteroidetes bacterium]
PWDESGLWHKYSLAYRTLEREARTPRRRPDGLLSDTIAALDQWYLLQRLRFGCALLNRKQVLAEESNLALMPALLAQVVRQAGDGADVPLIEAYALVYQLQEGGADTLFGQAQTMVEKNRSLLPHGQIKELYAYLMNHCIQQINVGRSPYEETLLALYQTQLDQGILQQEGHLSPWDFKNIVSLGIKMKRYAWLESFLAEWGPQLPEVDREAAMRYNEAMLRHAQGRSGEALRLLRDHTFQDPFYELGARTTLLKIYFEREDEEALNYHLDAFGHYVRRPRAVSVTQKALYSALIRYTRRLSRVRIRLKYGLARPAELARLQAQVKENHQVAQRAWLLEQLQVLSQAPEG